MIRRPVAYNRNWAVIIMPARAACIGGPLRGRWADLESAYQPEYIAHVQVHVDVLEVGDDGEPLPAARDVYYYVSQVRLFGATILVASTREPPANHDLFQALASDLAKDVALT